MDVNVDSRVVMLNSKLTASNEAPPPGRRKVELASPQVDHTSNMELVSPLSCSELSHIRNVSRDISRMLSQIL